MAVQANVRSVETLGELRASFARYRAEAQVALQRASQELARTQEWLAGRQRHWQAQVQRCQQTVQQAQAALRRCQNSGYTDAQGRRHTPDCRQHEQALAQATARLRAAEAELQTVRHWIQTVGEAAQSYQRQAGRLASLMESDLAEAEGVLAQKIAALRAYLALHAPAGASYSTAPPLDALTDTFTASLAMGMMGVVGPALHLVRQMAGNIRAALGDTGESLVTRLLQEQFGWQELAFDQPKHGFDRVFTAPGLPLIVVESKVNRAGKLRLGRTQDGEQGSAAWIAAQAERMADPDSAQYSPQNARLAALIQELGPENIPVVAVVIQTETGMADLYYRKAGTAVWHLLQEDVSLTAALATDDLPQE